MLRRKLWRGYDPLCSLPRRLFAVDTQGWNSNHRYLIELIEHKRPTVVVELGVWKGASTIAMATRMKELALDAAVIAVDTWLGGWDHWLQDQWFDELAFEHGYPRLFHKFLSNVLDAGVQDYVVPLPLDSLNAWHVLKRLDIRVDAVHIDGGHDYETVVSDMHHWWQLLNPGGLLIGDDYFAGGSTWPEVRRATDDFLKTVPHSEFEFSGGKCRIAKPGTTERIGFDQIGICMIVFNEEQFLEPCLKRLIAHFRYFTVLDMESTDRTLEIVRDLLCDRVTILSCARAELLRFGYAWSRNLTVEASKSPWLLHIDADEMIVAGLETGCVEFHVPNPVVATLERRNLIAPPDAVAVQSGLGVAYAVKSTEHHFRLHRQQPDIRRRGYIHEELWLGDRSAFGQGPKTAIVTEHYADFRPHHAKQSKGERYSWMLLNAFANRELQEGTNRYWYDQHVPAELERLAHDAQAFAEREGLECPLVPEQVP
ncbi:MAG: class I SAM-dependent methyltransferase [Alphaproteobacteria bacterium]|nr:class I SAM-dependent methyltransferase [Alphaproteobacteria bacterium]